MASLRFACPKTNQHVSTGVETDVQGLSASWKATLRVKCPHCGEEHAISVRETYINGSLADSCNVWSNAASVENGPQAFAGERLSEARGLFRCLGDAIQIPESQQVGRSNCASLLQQNLEEEKAADKKLTGIAEGRVNRVAA